MRPLRPDFSPGGRGLQWAALAFVVVALVITVVGTVGAVRARTQALETQAAVEAVRQRIAAEEERQHARAPVVSEPYAEDARRVVAIASMPLDAVLRSLERIRLPEVRLLSLNVQAETGQVRVEVEAPDLEQASRVLADLNAGLEAPRWRWVASRLELGPKPRALVTLESRWSGSTD